MTAMFGNERDAAARGVRQGLQTLLGTVSAIRRSETTADGRHLCTFDLSRDSVVELHTRERAIARPGERVIVVGKLATSGVFRAYAYRNIDRSVTGGAGLISAYGRIGGGTLLLVPGLMLVLTMVRLNLSNPIAWTFPAVGAGLATIGVLVARRGLWLRKAERLVRAWREESEADLVNP